MSLLSNIKINTPNSEITRINESQNIAEEQKRSSNLKYMQMCQYLNVDSIEINSLKICLLTCSRFWTKDVPSDIPICEIIGIPDISILDSESVANILSVNSFSTSNSDWAFYLDYLEVKDDLNEDVLYSNPVFKQFLTIVQENMLPTCGMSICKFSMFLFLFQSISNTPAVRMVEKWIGKMCQLSNNEIPHDLELRVMRTVTGIYDYNLANGDMLICLANILCNMTVNPSLSESIRFLLAQKKFPVQEKKNSRVGRPRLQERIKTIHIENKPYDCTFEHWEINQRFSINISNRMRKFLYFIKVQRERVPDELYLKYFDANNARLAINSTVDQIDHSVVLEIIHLVRTHDSFQQRIDSLVDFRQYCFNGIAISARKNLSKAATVQLYIASFQHESIREVCWKSVVDSYNYITREAVREFTKTNKFEVQPIMDTIFRSLFD